MDLQKMTGLLVKTAAVGALGIGLVLGARSITCAQSDDNAAAATTKSTKIVSAVGTTTVTTATSCINVVCPTGDTCTSEVLTATSKNFNRFGGFKSNSQLVLCETIDTTLRSTLSGCAQASGIGVLTSGTNTITFSLSGESCALPGLVTGLEAFNQVGAITNSTDSSISSGGGAFNAWDNGSAGSFNLNVNYSK